MSIRAIFFLLFVCSSIITSGQKFKTVRVGAGLGVFTSTSNANNGWLIFIEPSYRTSDNFFVGFRYEGAYNKSMSVLSYSFNGQYYFSSNTSRVRSFVGLGAGLYIADYNSIGSFNTNLETALGKTSFGFYPRVGFDFGHFSLSVDWNISSESKVTFIEYLVGGSKVYAANVNPSYLSIRGSICLGGGKKK
ncbi:MAG: hypothetical protein JSS73_14875 [Bacteroidetes bacterium]|nr:hypothetical protein [Bacteroidota bacterium]